MDIFIYGEKEIEHLKHKDKRLGAAIDRIGPIKREVSPGLFPSLVNSIVGQQISSKALNTVWNRMLQDIGEICPRSIADKSVDEIQRYGISYRKAYYIKNAAEKILNEKFNIEALSEKSDEEVCKELVQLDGVGLWTAEMLMTFSMQRSNIMSFGDLAIHRGLRMLYHHKEISRALFDKYKKRYAPYATVASLYLWAIAGGAIEEMKDYAPKSKGK